MSSRSQKAPEHQNDTSVGYTVLAQRGVIRVVPCGTPVKQAAHFFHLHYGEPRKAQRKIFHRPVSRYWTIPGSCSSEASEAMFPTNSTECLRRTELFSTPISREDSSAEFLPPFGREWGHERGLRKNEHDRILQRSWCSQERWQEVIV